LHQVGVTNHFTWSSCFMPWRCMLEWRYSTTEVTQRGFVNYASYL